jgi:sulfotransferase
MIIVMDKTFFFMAGLPRSGSTLLSAILNQNPDIYASPQTDLLQMMYLLDTNIPTLESYKAGVKVNDYSRVIKELGQTFYSNQSQPIIIDKNRAWSTPGNFHLAQVLNSNVKIIMPYRPILEILTSFITLVNKYPNNNFIDRSLNQNDFYSKYYRSLDDARCDWLMRSNGEIDQALLGLAQVKDKPNQLHLVKYQDLMDNPSNVMNDIYSFLEIPNFQHTFTRIKSPNQKLGDSNAFGIPTLHYVRADIKKVSQNPEQILSKYVVEK